MEEQKGGRAGAVVRQERIIGSTSWKDVKLMLEDNRQKEEQVWWQW